MNTEILSELERLNAIYETDKKHSDTPWEYWEVFVPHKGWENCNDYTFNFFKFKYRRKLDAPDWNKKEWSPEGKQLKDGREFKFYAYYLDQSWPIHGAVLIDNTWVLRDFLESSFEEIPKLYSHIMIDDHVYGDNKKRHFAGIREGRPTVWVGGMTSFTSHESGWCFVHECLTVEEYEKL